MRARLQEKLKQRNQNTEPQGASRVPQQDQEPEQEENNKENNNTNK